MSSLPASRRRGPVERAHQSAILMHQAGNTDVDTANSLGVTRQAIQAWRKRHGIAKNSRVGRLYTPWHYRALDLALKGHDADEITEALGQKYDTVVRLLWMFRKRGRL